MEVNYIALAVPFFFLLIGVELLLQVLWKREVYRFNDSINNLSCGIADQVLDVFLKVALFAGYLWVYHHGALLSIPTDSVLAWVAVFLGVDFCYYWFHRASHEVAFIWGAHVVHHQSEEYNLSVALRQAALQSSFSWVFYLPLALIGFPPVMFLTMSAFNTLYQFWIHTRLIGKLGPLEWVLNTPSHHRVHHGSDLKSLDKNYGGTTILWDRLFGTFQAEEEEPHYGIVHPLSSWNPLWANAAYWIALTRGVKATPGLRDKLRMLLKPPGWKTDGTIDLPAPGTQTFVNNHPRVPLGLNLYVLAQFVPALLAAVHTMKLGDEGAPAGILVALAILVILSLTSLGALLEAKGWGLKLEMGRLVLVGALAAQLGSTEAAALLGFVLASGLWLLTYRRLFAPAAAAMQVA